jgi:hypothetical protein
MDWDYWNHWNPTGYKWNTTVSQPFNGYWEAQLLKNGIPHELLEHPWKHPWYNL